MTRQNIKIAAGGAGVFALSLALAACGSTSGSAGGAGVSSGSVVSQAGQGARLTGTYSSQDFWNWVPNNLYPSLLTQVPGGAYKSEVVKPNTKYQLASMSCPALLQNTAGPGFGEEAYLIDQGQNAAGSEIYSYSVYEFASASEATGFVTGMAAKFKACASFTLSTQKGNVQISMGFGPSSEEQVPAANAVVDLRQAGTIGGHLINSDDVVAADGNVVLIETGSSNTGSMPQAVNLDQVAQTTLAAFAAGQAQFVASHALPDYVTSTAQPPPGSGARIGGGAR